MKLKPVILFFCLLGLFVNAKATSPPDYLEVFLEKSSDDSAIVFNDTVFNATSNIKVSMVLILHDTIGINSIHVKLGSSAGSLNLLQKQFVFDTAGTLPDGTSYRREGLVVYLYLGKFVGLNNASAEVKIEDTSNNISPPILFSI